MVTDYIEAIKAFPALPKPEIFGLHENADITCDQNETYNLFSTILALQPRVSGGGGASREDTILHLCETISSKVRPLLHMQQPTVITHVPSITVLPPCISTAVVHTIRLRSWSNR